MKLEQAYVLDRLALDEPCLGAAFTTYTFEPAFFEHHVLASVLRVGADPDEAAAAYHEEALAALQATPVVCFVDGSVRPPGHQLPYDLREIRGRCFHPKVALLLYAEVARLSVGSGNLTRPGLGGNAETFFVRDLRYGDPHDASILREVLRFLTALDEQARPRGTQTAAVLDTLQRRIAATQVATEPASFAFLHTEGDTPLLSQLLALLPDNAKLTRIGVLAPFFERDDQSDDPGADLASVLVELTKRATKTTVLDVGVSWDDASLSPGGTSPVAVRDALEQLWARKDEERVRYFAPLGETAASYRFIDHAGASRLVPKDELDDAVADGTAWRVGRPRVYAPAALIHAAGERVGTVHTWLFPSPQLIDDHKITRPLHAKLVLLTYRSGTKTRTLVMLGSANASRMAMLALPAQGGNAEACIAYIADDELELRDLVPELTLCAAPIDWQERTFDEPAPLPTIPMVASAVLDARARTLTVTWEPAGELGAWEVHYLDERLLSATGAPTSPLVIAPFELVPASCELRVSAHDGELTFPILVEDLAALPLTHSATTPDFRTLLAMLGRRLTPARYRTLIERHGRAMVDATLDTLFGDGFAPTDVFRAWWNVADDLAAEGLSVAGFRLRLHGTLGAATVWAALCDATELRTEEVWFYGAELLRTLRAIELPDDPDREPKAVLLAALLDALRAQLAATHPRSVERPWVTRVIDFYLKGLPA